MDAKSPSWAHQTFVYILVTSKKPANNPSKISRFLHGIFVLKMSYEIAYFPHWYEKSQKQMFYFFWKPRAPVLVFSHVSFKTFFQIVFVFLKFFQIFWFFLKILSFIFCTKSSSLILQTPIVEHRLFVKDSRLIDIYIIPSALWRTDLDILDCISLSLSLNCGNAV